MKHSTFVCSLLSLFFIPISLVNAATFEVTTLNDNGAGSLREAITNANQSNNSVINFTVSGTITLNSPLPDITKQTTIDGSTAPSFADAPVVAIDFSEFNGLVIAAGADGSAVKSLSLINSSEAAIRLQASKVAIAGNYIGLDLTGNPSPNQGEGIFITSSSEKNLIGNFNPVTGLSYYTEAVIPSESSPYYPVSQWKGLRGVDNSDATYMLTGSSSTSGLLYIGTIDGTSGNSYLVQYPDAVSTVVYGANDTGQVDGSSNEIYQLVGNYSIEEDSETIILGFIWTGTVADLPSGGTWETVMFPHAAYQSTNSLMGSLAVGNAFKTKGSNAHGRFKAYIYDQTTHSFVNEIHFPGAKSTTANGIWQNSDGTYTICGGYTSAKIKNSNEACAMLKNGRAYIVDFNPLTGSFSNWKSFEHPRNGLDFATSFSGISSVNPGVYTLSANSIPLHRDPALALIQGSIVTIRRNTDGEFEIPGWVDIQDPNTSSALSCNSVYDTNIVGINPSTITPYQATVNLGFQLSNVISGNYGNGIKISGSKDNIIAMNYIGTSPCGNTAMGNGKNGILITNHSSDTLIGGQIAGDNNPTGTKGTVTPVFLRPPQGNLISGNALSGVHIKKSSFNNLLSGNFIGTDQSGSSALGNGLHGIYIEQSDGNQLIGCTFRQNPFVFYNVISGNIQDGIHLKNADNTVVQGNFIGINYSNNGVIPNGSNGITVAGNSKNTQVGGVIPLGNVISGNALNGMAVIDKASGFITFNTFGGLFAFSTAAPNGQNALLITSTGGNNVARTNIFSGNNWNGIEICGDASGVQVMDTSCGLYTDLNAALPNGRNGILIGGTAHDNVIGGLKPSIEIRNHLAGNTGYGISIEDNAHDNLIFGSDIGLVTDNIYPNEAGGILLDSGTYATVITKNRIGGNDGAGITISSSRENKIVNSTISSNTEYGIYASGNCQKTIIKNNIILENGSGPSDNVDISAATGIIYKP